jgi:hypothetical protein
MKTSNLYTVEEQSEKTRPALLNRMDAIAQGVQARFEESTGYSKRVIDATINVAKALGVPESEIDSWAAHRLNLIARETERLREIKSLLTRLYGNSLGIASESK